MEDPTQGSVPAEVLAILTELPAPYEDKTFEQILRIVAVTDSRKIGRVGFAPFLPITSLDALVTDRDADALELDGVRAAGVEVVVV